jgi:hypothetical protein
VYNQASEGNEDIAAPQLDVEIGKLLLSMYDSSFKFLSAALTQLSTLQLSYESVV